MSVVSLVSRHRNGTKRKKDELERLEEDSYGIRGLLKEIADDPLKYYADHFTCGMQRVNELCPFQQREFGEHQQHLEQQLVNNTQRITQLRTDMGDDLP